MRNSLLARGYQNNHRNQTDKTYANAQITSTTPIAYTTDTLPDAGKNTADIDTAGDVASRVRTICAPPPSATLIAAIASAATTLIRKQAQRNIGK